MFTRLRAKKPIEQLLAFALYVYAIYLVDILFFPIIYNNHNDEIFKLNYNLIPFRTIYELYIHDIAFGKQVIGNIVMFIPIGFTVPILFKYFNNIKRIAILSFVISLSIELTQGLINVLTKYSLRSTDIDDLILNIMGGILGFVLFTVLKKPLANTFDINISHIPRVK